MNSTELARLGELLAVALDDPTLANRRTGRARARRDIERVRARVVDELTIRYTEGKE